LSSEARTPWAGSGDAEVGVLDEPENDVGRSPDGAVTMPSPTSAPGACSTAPSPMSADSAAATSDTPQPASAPSDRIATRCGNRGVHLAACSRPRFAGGRVPISPVEE
jgi:hypothetical protein